MYRRQGKLWGVILKFLIAWVEVACVDDRCVPAPEAEALLYTPPMFEG